MYYSRYLLNIYIYLFNQITHMKLVLWKPYGITSNFFTQQLQSKYNYTSICYAGRLDPLAQGIMLILTDSDVKTMSTHLTHNKIYTFDIILGFETTSADIAGSVLNDIDIHYTLCIDKTYIYNKLIDFISSYKHQVYPPISSFVVKHPVHGRNPLWWYAKNNIHIELPSKPVDIYAHTIENIAEVSTQQFYTDAIQRLETITNLKTIEELDIHTFLDYYKSKLNQILTQSNLDMPQTLPRTRTSKIKISMTLNVSSGFYIRQFCEDFGKHIHIPGIAFDITRTNIY